MQDEDGNTPLHLAAVEGHVVSIYHLLQAGGERLAAVTNKQGKTARDLAVSGTEPLRARLSLAHRTVVALDSDTVGARLGKGLVKTQELATSFKADSKRKSPYMLKYKEEEDVLRREHTRLVDEHAAELRKMQEEHARLVTEHASVLSALEEQHAAALRETQEQHKRQVDLRMAAIRALEEEHAAAIRPVGDGLARFRALQDRAQSLHAEYIGSYDETKAVLTDDEYKAVIETVLIKSNSQNPGGGEKFLSDPKQLVVGEFKEAAKGVAHFSGFDEDDLNLQVARGLEAMQEEVEKFGNAEVLEMYDYVVNQSSSPKEYPNGIRDEHRDAWLLEDFLQDESAKVAGLKRAEVAALRLYTTLVYLYINGPLRDLARVEARKAVPLGVITMLVYKAIKKLRQVNASSDSATARQVLWRGMKDVEVTTDFMTKGEPPPSPEFLEAIRPEPDTFSLPP
jgi:hypothetical protein